MNDLKVELEDIKNLSTRDELQSSLKKLLYIRNVLEQDQSYDSLFVEVVDTINKIETKLNLGGI